MEIVHHSHHANVSDRLRGKAEGGVRRLARRLGGTVGATIRFDHDGPVRVVELVLHAPGRRHLVARAEGKFWGPTIGEAVKQLERQVDHTKRTRKEQGRRGVAERRAMGA